MANDVTIRCNKELRDKLNLYLEIKNKDKKHNEPKIKQPDIINRLLSDFLKDKVLTNTFILQPSNINYQPKQKIAY